MFSNQDIDYSLNQPCRALSALAPPSSKSKKPNTSASDDDDDGGDMDNGWDEDDDYLDTSSSLTSHQFLVGSAIPSVSKLSDSCNDGDEDDDGINNHHSIVEEDDEERINRLYLLQYHEDSHELTQDSAWVHPTGEVWSMGCHPTRGDWVVTCGGGSVFSENMMGSEDEETSKQIPLTKYQTTLWRLPDLNENGEDDFDFSEPRQRTESTATASSVLTTSSKKLEPLVNIPHGENSSSLGSSGWEQRVGQILWNPLLSAAQSSGDVMCDLAETSSHDGAGNLITVGWDAKSPICLWDISSLSSAKEVWSTHGSGVASSRRQMGNRFQRFVAMSSSLPRRVSWDPHNAHSILATSGIDVVAYDMRAPASSGGMGAIRSAHRYGVADVCHNHLQSNVVVTSGMDGVMKFWDLRMHLSDGLDAIASSGNSDGNPGMPPPLLKAVRGGHSHWTTRAVYNPFYDQLVLSGGSDGIANLWRISSCSSAPLLELGDEEEDDEEISGGSFDGDGMEGEEDDGVNNGGDDNYDQQDWINAIQPTNENEADDEDDKEDQSKSPRDNDSNAQDVRVTRFECSDVTADLAWSATDPWVYASLSYDGAMVVHHVPSKEKYKILL